MNLAEVVFRLEESKNNGVGNCPTLKAVLSIEG